MSDRLYCTAAEVLADLDLAGVKDEAKLVRAIRSASEFIDKRLGWFIPETGTRRFDGNGERHLFIDPVLAVTTVVDDGDTLTSTQYLSYPRNRHWTNGPYTRLTVDPDASELSAWTAEEDSVAVTGRWGKYEESIATGATTTQADTTGTSLAASSGANISPGAVLLVGTEQELVEATGAVTDSTADAEEIDNAQDEIVVSDGTQCSTGEIIKVQFEQMKILDVSGNRWYVERGWNGTKRAAHTTGASVYVYRTFTVKRGVNGTTAATHAAAAISRYVPPYDVNALCRQLAALELKMAETGYSGRAGNAELGENYYFAKYPNEIIRVLANYRIVGI